MTRSGLLALMLSIVTPQLATADSILVYDAISHHQLAFQAAQSTGATVVRATNDTFESLLRSRSWDLVLSDMPSSLPPDGAMRALADHVNGGGKAVMSFWTWQTQPALSAAFGVQPLHDIFLTGGTTLYDFGTSPVFEGVTMPNADWHNHWNDDGDVFSLTNGGVFLAGVAPDSSGVMALTNSGRTIVAPLFDEAGATWLTDGSGVRLWGNMITLLDRDLPAPVPEPATLTLLALGLGAAASRQKFRRPSFRA
jgi:hypothetical protein